MIKKHSLIFRDIVKDFPLSNQEAPIKKIQIITKKSKLTLSSVQIVGNQLFGMILSVVQIQLNLQQLRLKTTLHEHVQKHLIIILTSELHLKSSNIFVQNIITAIQQDLDRRLRPPKFRCFY